MIRTGDRTKAVSRLQVIPVSSFLNDVDFSRAAARKLSALLEKTAVSPKCHRH
jgi:hypothetical protein